MDSYSKRHLLIPLYKPYKFVLGISEHSVDYLSMDIKVFIAAISTKTKSLSELSADLTGMSVGVGWTLFCLFREAIYERACTSYQ